ncbi:MAG: hypothetical protein ACK467_07330 [Opitutia bacterium]
MEKCLFPKFKGIEILMDFCRKQLLENEVGSLLSNGNVLLYGSAGGGKSLLIARYFLPYIAKQGTTFVVCDFNGDYPEEFRKLEFNPWTQTPSQIAALARNSLMESTVVQRPEPGSSVGEEWDVFLAELMVQMEKAKQPLRKWWLLVDVSSHSHSLSNLPHILERSERYNLNVIVTSQGPGRLGKNLLRHFNRFVQCGPCAFKVDRVVPFDLLGFSPNERKEVDRATDSQNPLEITIIGKKLIPAYFFLKN